MGGMTSTENDKNPSPPVSESNAGAADIPARVWQLGQEQDTEEEPTGAQMPARPGNTTYLSAQQTRLSPHQAAGQRAGCGPIGSRNAPPCGLAVRVPL